MNVRATLFTRHVIYAPRYLLPCDVPSKFITWNIDQICLKQKDHEETKIDEEWDLKRERARAQ